MSLTEQEFMDLLETYRHEFFRYIYKHAWHPDTAEDIFSEAVLAAWRPGLPDAAQPPL